MNNLIPNRLIPKRVVNTVNSRSSYIFLRMLSKYYPDPITAKQILSEFYPNYHDSARKDKLTAHLDYFIALAVLMKINSHFRFTNNPSAKGFFEAVKEGRITEEKEAFRKFILPFDLTEKFLDTFGGKKQINTSELNGFLRTQIPLKDDQFYKYATRFIAQTFKKAGIIEAYKPRKRLIIIQPKFSKFAQQTTFVNKKLKPQIKSVRIVHPDIEQKEGEAKMVYTVTLSDPSGEKTHYVVSFEELCKIAGILKDKKDTKKGG